MSSTDQPSALEQKKNMGHGMPVPTINLEKAIGLMNKVWDKEKRHPAPVSSIMTHWGYGLKSSGGFQAVASMKRFGLLLEEGSKEKRTLQLSPLALDLLKNSTVDLQTYYRLLKQAALTPKAHQELWAKYNADLPSDITLQGFLVFDKNFSDEAAKQFIQIYKDTIAYAKLGSGDVISDENQNGEDDELDGDEDTPAAPLPPVKPAFSTPTSLPPSLTKPPSPMVNPEVRYFAIPTDAGDAMIPMGMSEEDFALFQGALALFKKKIIKQSRFPVGAIWRNNDSDKPVTIVAEMGQGTDGARYFQSQDGTGIPESELTFA